jgi:hypothetical protein
LKHLTAPLAAEVLRTHRSAEPCLGFHADAAQEPAAAAGAEDAAPEAEAKPVRSPPEQQTPAAKRTRLELSVSHDAPQEPAPAALEPHVRASLSVCLVRPCWAGFPSTSQILGDWGFGNFL